MTTEPPRLDRTARVARLVTHALLIALGVVLLIYAVTDWSLSDATAYWRAAERLRAGEELYPQVPDVEASSVYRYAPWFAYAAVPFTLLPVPVAAFVWSSILIAASVAAVVPLVLDRHVTAAFFFGSVLVGISAIGNAQPLVVAALVWGVERRSGPLWIGLTASLKAVPILFAIVYLGRREWGKFVWCLVWTVALVAPFLLHDLTYYVTDPGDAGILIGWPPVYVAAVAAGVVVTLLAARGRFGWVAAATTVAIALPRFFVYDVTFLLPGNPAGAEAASTKRWLWPGGRSVSMRGDEGNSKGIHP